MGMQFELGSRGAIETNTQQVFIVVATLISLRDGTLSPRSFRSAEAQTVEEAHVGERAVDPGQRSSRNHGAR